MILTFVDSWPIYLQSIAFVVGLIVGTICLVKFCDIFVDSASTIAKKLHISELIIGLTVVAIGTSCPELAVSVSDSISSLLENSNANVAIGNVIGSNICNLLLVLGFSAVFTPIVVKKSVCKREYPFLLIISALLVLFVILFGTGSSITGNYAILRWEAIILVVLMFVYIRFLIHNAKKHPDEQLNTEEEKLTEEKEKDMKLWKAIILVIVGAAGIVFGGEAVVFGAKGLALQVSDAAHLNHDLAESLVGLTIVAVGTSLPELVTSVVAAKKGQNELALGNVIGSNIFNILFVLGIAGTVNPLTTGSQVIIDAVVMMVATIVVFIFALTGKIKRSGGIALLCMYGAYLAYLIVRTIM